MNHSSNERSVHSGALVAMGPKASAATVPMALPMEEMVATPSAVMANPAAMAATEEAVRSTIWLPAF